MESAVNPIASGFNQWSSFSLTLARGRVKSIDAFGPDDFPDAFNGPEATNSGRLRFEERRA